MSQSPFRIETLAIGDELLTGRIADTNSAWVAAELYRRGLRLERVTVVADDDADIAAAIEAGAARGDVVVSFGGLGPTSDDRTAAVVANLLGGGLAEHAPSKERLLRFLAERGLTVTAASLKQVVYPARTTAIANDRGLAVGFTFERGKSRFYFLPGVPHEMKAMFSAAALPEIEARAGSRGRLLTRTWKCLGIPESDLQIRMNPIEAVLPAHGWLGYRTRFPENHLTLYLRRLDAEDDARFAELESQLRASLGPLAYTEAEKEPEALVLEQLEAAGRRLALAESCTGGLAASRLTRVAGASTAFWGSYVTYRSEAKAAMLGVEVATDEAAVSAVTTRRLAEQARAAGSVEVAAAITGFLGPTGGTAADPIGTLYLCVGDGRRWDERRIVQPYRDREGAAFGAATQLLVAILRFLQSA